MVLVGAAGLTYRLVDRGWADRWGATDPELRTPMPGDQLVRQPIFDSTRAVTIHAPAADVWPWLVQLGAGRGGLYSYDRAEQLLGVDVHNADRILPEHQRLAVGDTIWITQEGYPAKLVFKVAEVTPERSLLLAFTEDPHSRTVPTDPGWTWSFVLQPVDAQTTRLLLRDRQASMGNPVIDAFMGGLVGPVGFVMTRKMLEGIAERTEGLAGTGGGRSRTEPLFFWLLGLGAAGAVAIAVTPRRRWWWRLGLGTLAAGALTQVLFRGFPSPWPAGLVALGSVPRPSSATGTHPSGTPQRQTTDTGRRRTSTRSLGWRNATWMSAATVRAAAVAALVCRSPGALVATGCLGDGPVLPAADGMWSRCC